LSARPLRTSRSSKTASYGCTNWDAVSYFSSAQPNRLLDRPKVQPLLSVSRCSEEAFLSKFDRLVLATPNLHEWGAVTADDWGGGACGLSKTGDGSMTFKWALVDLNSLVQFEDGTPASDKVEFPEVRQSPSIAILGVSHA
jgi:hypothetical protein